MRISDEAVEAAALTAWEQPDRSVTWETEEQAYKDALLSLARLALEAAAPHMLKSAYDLGFQHGSNEPANPYRATK